MALLFYDGGAKGLDTIGFDSARIDEDELAEMSLTGSHIHYKM